MISDPQLQETDSNTKGARPRGTMPGALPAGIGVVLSAALCWAWLANASGRATSATGGVAVSELSEVTEQEVPGALTTLAGSTAFLAQFKDESLKCRQPLAWVSAVAAPSAKASTIRLRSGNYITPLFTLAANPVRIAIPYPAAYEAGHGSLTVLGATSRVVIGLTPPWQPPEGTSAATAEVHWAPIKTCRNSNG
jgi:hypothetical protein